MMWRYLLQIESLPFPSFLRDLKHETAARPMKLETKVIRSIRAIRVRLMKKTIHLTS